MLLWNNHFIAINRPVLIYKESEQKLKLLLIVRKAYFRLVDPLNTGTTWLTKHSWRTQLRHVWSIQKKRTFACKEFQIRLISQLDFFCLQIVQIILAEV